MKSKFLFTFSLLAILATISLTNSCKKDPCSDTVCLNDGICINGECDCADGYQGPSCGDQKTPIKMRISKIVITDFPQYDNGESWDFGSGPDLHVYVSKDGSLVHEQQTVFENAESSLDYTYSPNGDIDITDPTAKYVVGLYDYDSGSDDDYMGGISFYPYFSNTNGFPETITLSAAGSSVSFIITVSYVW